MILHNLQQATILRRYKRFLADLKLESGEEVIAHVPNTGSMRSCWAEGWPSLITQNNDPKRKLHYTLEMTHNGETWIGINTSRTNQLAVEAIKNNVIKELSDYQSLRQEFTIGESRIDLLLQSSLRPDCLVEVKNVTLRENLENKLATFPDSVTARGSKHLDTLADWAVSGKRAVMLYIIQREDVEEFAPAVDIDPFYAKQLKRAMELGVEVLCYRCNLSPREILVSKKLPLKKW